MGLFCCIYSVYTILKRPDTEIWIKRPKLASIITLLSDCFYRLRNTQSSLSVHSLSLSHNLFRCEAGLGNWTRDVRRRNDISSVSFHRAEKMKARVDSSFKVHSFQENGFTDSRHLSLNAREKLIPLILLSAKQLQLFYLFYKSLHTFNRFVVSQSFPSDKSVVVPLLISHCLVSSLFWFLTN